MGSLIGSPAAQAAFDNQINKKGLDLKRCRINSDDGTNVADSAAVIRAGMIVSRNATGYVIPATGTDVFGVAKWGKTSLGISVRVDQPLVLSSTTATSVGRGSINNVSVRSAVLMAGTTYTGGGTDYTAVAAAGTIARVALGAITDGQTVYVTYTYELVDSDYQFDGLLFQNQPENRAQYNENRMTVIQGHSRIFTMEWMTGTAVATGLAYALTGATADLFCSATGKFSNVAANEYMGKVYQVPTADDPYLGLTMHGNPVV